MTLTTNKKLLATAVFLLMVVCVSCFLTFYMWNIHRTRRDSGEVVCMEYSNPQEFANYYAFDFFKPTCTRYINCTSIDLLVDELFGHTDWYPRIVVTNIPDLSDYDLLLLRVSGSVEGGRQYDRPLWVFINGIPVFWGSTTMYGNFTSEVDVTIFKNLFKNPLNITIYLPNWIIPEMNLMGFFKINITLIACKLGVDVTGLPDLFVPLWSSELFRDVDAGGITFTTVKIPDNACRVLLFLRSKGRGREEFWFRETPALRNIFVFYNNELVGVYSPFPVIYTGGIFPFYWNPQPSINTLVDRSLYFFDLTPFALTSRVGNLTLIVVNINESAAITGGVHQFQLSGGLAIWTCPLKLLNATYTRVVNTSRTAHPDDSLNYSEIITYRGVFTYVLQYENTRCTYEYRFGGEARALKSKQPVSHVVTQVFEVGTKSRENNEICTFSYEAKGLYTVNVTSHEVSKKIISRINGVERYQYSSRDLIHLVFTQTLLFNNYELNTSEGLYLGGYVNIGLAETEKGVFITGIYDFSSITHRNVGIHIVLGGITIEISGWARSTSNRLDTHGRYIEFNATCKLTNNRGD